MEDEARTPKAGVGIVSLTVVFSVLCLTIFSVLALSAALTEQKFSEKRISAQRKYYEADRECAGIANEIGRLWEAGDKEKLLLFLEENSLQYEQAEGLRVFYQRSIDEHQHLEVVLRLDGSFVIERWQVVGDGEWKAEDHIDVWDGDLVNGV